MDKFEQIAAHSQFCAVVLGNLETSDFELVCLAVEEVDPPSLQAVRMARQLSFLGILGVTQDGQFRSALEVPLPDCAVTALAKTFARLVVKKFVGEGSVGDSAGWLTKLHSLPDLREN